MEEEGAAGAQSPKVRPFQCLGNSPEALKAGSESWAEGRGHRAWGPCEGWAPKEMVSSEKSDTT